MPLTLDASNHQLIVSLAALVINDSAKEITAESIEAVLTAASIKAPAGIINLFATHIEKAGGVDKFLAGPSAGGAAAAAAPAAAAAGAPAAKVEKVKEEVVVDALEGGMDMFGGGGDKTGDY